MINSEFQAFFQDFPWGEVQKIFVGLDDVWQTLDQALSLTQRNYPPHNIEKLNNDHWLIRMALAGFKKTEIEVSLEQTPDRILIVRSILESDETEKNYVHQGIGARNFNKRIMLSDEMEVGKVHMKDGILSIEIKRVVTEGKTLKTFTVE
jgi:molecular chaperone IbpA